MARRIERIDALRGLAVFGIMLVNVWGFAYGFSLYSVSLNDTLSLGDKVSVFLVAAFAEQKFYPIFAFLFGAGFALQTGGLRAPGPALDAVTATYRRRLTWLLACGILHGTLLWFGDILTAYSLVGFWLAGSAGRRLRSLLGTLRILVLVNAVLIGGLGAVAIAFGQAEPKELVTLAQDAFAEHAAFTQGGWTDAALMRLKNYGINLASLVVFGPFLALLFVLGVFAVRLGWLTRPQRHRAVWRRILIGGLALGLPFNLWWGMHGVAAIASPFAPPPGAALGSVLLELAGPCLAAATVAGFMLARERGGAWLVPVGRMALSCYLGQSVLLMFLLQGFGLGLGALLSRAQLLLLCAAIMAAQLLFCRWWLASHAQGPAEALWRRYTYRSQA